MSILRLPCKRNMLIWTAAAIAAAAGTLSLMSALPTERSEAPARQEHDIPAEVQCLVAASAREMMPESICADKPRLRLREYAPGQFELFYWGNPIRPHYAYSVRKISSAQSMLRNNRGNTERWRTLPVTVPRRTDKRLPLQPVIKLTGLHGKAGEYYAAQVSVHDAATGQILCTAIYLLCGN